MENDSQKVNYSLFILLFLLLISLGGAFYLYYTGEIFAIRLRNLGGVDFNRAIKVLRYFDASLQDKSTKTFDREIMLREEYQAEFLSLTDDENVPGKKIIEVQDFNKSTLKFYLYENDYQNLKVFINEAGIVRPGALEDLQLGDQIKYSEDNSLLGNPGSIVPRIEILR